MSCTHMYGSDSVTMRASTYVTFWNRDMCTTDMNRMGLHEEPFPSPKITTSVSIE